VTEPNGAIGRDRSGRFALGCAGGPGNPRLRALAAHQQAIADALTPEQVGEVVRSLYAGALAGDTLAAKALLDRIAGKPAEAPAVVDVGEVNADTLHHGDGVADLGARLLAAAAAGEVDLRDAERLLLLLDRLGAARDGWGRRPDALAMAQRAQDGTP
jgi:hypothetical protein